MDIFEPRHVEHKYMYTFDESLKWKIDYVWSQKMYVNLKSG